MLKIGTVVIDEDGCIGIVCIKYADGDTCIIENDSAHPNPRKCGEADVTRFAGDESFREMVRDALEFSKSVNPSMVCDRLEECEGWEKSYRAIQAALKFYLYRFGGPYCGKPFKFCPWCGRELKWEQWERLGGKWKIENDKGPKSQKGNYENTLFKQKQ